MPRFQVAHVHEQGIDLIIVLLDSSFKHKSVQDQDQIVAELQVCANSANLRGTVVPVWDDGGGRLAFRALPQWHQFFKSINFQWFAVNAKLELSCW
ncbi:MAG: hypothetical protein WCC04_18560 [Terriglobales bacterium]